MPRRDRQSPSPRADPVRIRNGSETPVALTRNAAYGRLKNRHAVDFCLRRSSSVPQRQRRETHRPQRGLAPQSGKCKPDFSSAGTGRSAETTQSAMLSRVPAACKGSRLPQALVSSGSRAASQKGLLLSMWYTPVDTLAITVFSWAVRCGCLCGDDKSITSEAGEQKSDCVGVEEHPCGD
jgi:hypothetical protein